MTELSAGTPQVSSHHVCFTHIHVLNISAHSFCGTNLTGLLYKKETFHRRYLQTFFCIIYQQRGSGLRNVFGWSNYKDEQRILTILKLAHLVLKVCNAVPHEAVLLKTCNNISGAPYRTPRRETILLGCLRLPLRMKRKWRNEGGINFINKEKAKKWRKKSREVRIYTQTR